MQDYFKEDALAELAAEAWSFSGYADSNRDLGRLHDATRELREMFATARRHEWGWQHEETIERAVIPVLKLLNFPNDCIRRTTEKFAGSRHRADIDIRNAFHTNCVIEVKKWATPLHRTEHYPDFHTPLDQVLFYFDRSSAGSSLVTNGVDWWLIRRARPEFAVRGVEYVAICFRLDEAIVASDDRLATFLGLFDYHAVIGQRGNKQVTYRAGLVVCRKSKPSKPSLILLSNFGDRPVGEGAAAIDVNAPNPFSPYAFL